MSSSLIITIVGPDRPGLIERLSRCVREAEGNWEESRMARLAGQFAGILRVTVDPARVEALEASLTSLREVGVDYNVHRSSEPQLSPARVLRMDVVGNDRPGIVQEISRALAQLEVNVEELTTSTESAPMAGGVLFRASAVVRASEAATSQVREALEKIAHELMVELTLDESD